LKKGDSNENPFRCSDLCSCIEIAKRIPKDGDTLAYDLLADRLKEYSEKCGNGECDKVEVLLNAGFQSGLDFAVNYTVYYLLYKILREAKDEIIGKCVSKATYYRILNRLKWLEEEESLLYIRCLVEELGSHLCGERKGRVSRSRKK